MKKEFISGKKKKVIGLARFIFALLVAGVTFYFYTSWIYSAISFLAALFLLAGYSIFRKRLIASDRIRKMEEVFPDFIELVSSNLRAGMTVDKALLMSSRKEFSPLDEEILQLGKDIMTGKEIASALRDLAIRTGSPKIQKTIDLVISGLKSGGNLAVILEETAVNMRERNFVEKRAASNVMMYVILIFFAIVIGAPALFALSSVLVGVLTNIIQTMPSGAEVSTNLPISMTKISISQEFITYFSIIFLVILDVLSSMLLGMISKGDEKQGLKYILIFVTISLGIFFLIKLSLSGYFLSMFS